VDSRASAAIAGSMEGQSRAGRRFALCALVPLVPEAGSVAGDSSRQIQALSLSLNQSRTISNRCTRWSGLPLRVSSWLSPGKR